MKKLLLLTIFATAFNSNAQSLVSVAPNNGNQGQTLDVVITGDIMADLYFVSTTTQVSFFNDLMETLTINSAQYDFSGGNNVNVSLTIPPMATPGLYSISVDPMLFSETLFLPDSFTVNQPLSISAFDYSSQILVSPNPASNKINLNTPQEFSNQSAFAIYNAQGKEVFRQNIKGEKTEINISKLPTGVYYLKTLYNSGVYTKKFIKK